MLRDVTVSEASKIGTLQEYHFFDKVRRALRCQTAYDNFLRCLLMYNNELIGKQELLLLVQTYLSKWKDLLAWFKNFMGMPDSNVSEEITTPPRLTQHLKEKHEGMAMEIDYTSLQRLGFSYRALPASYQQPKCTGRDELCRSVLNDKWVSFPTFSEDSTFVQSKKTAFEENIYRCEDERFEMDVVIEINQTAYKFFEYVKKKMSQDDKFRIDNYLTKNHDHEVVEDTKGPAMSETTLRKALKRIYGDQHKEFMNALRKEPKVSVPHILKRIRAKDEEWRQHHHTFKDVWRVQSEEFYLKSLDHQGPTFKQSDIKYIRSKALVSELEGLYDERIEALDSGTNVIPLSGPHMRVTYDDKSTIDDAASLIIHHVKRQAINGDDKEKIRHIVYQFLPDLYFAPRGNQASDDDDDDEDDSDEEEKKSRNGFFKTNGDGFAGYSPQDNMEGHYHLFMGNNYFYLFFRLHHLLCERLLKMNKISEELENENAKERRNRKNEESVCQMLGLAPPRDDPKSDLYGYFLDLTRQLLDNNINSSSFEDRIREKFTIHGYVTFTIDKLIQNIVRQLQHIVTDDTCIALLELYKSEEANMATGGTSSSQQRRTQQEAQYLRKSEHLTSSSNCMKITITQMRDYLLVGIELVDSEGGDDTDDNNYCKWSDYLEQYAQADENDISDELREKLEDKPVFLQRNANRLRATARNNDGDDDDDNLRVKETIEVTIDPNTYKMSFTPMTYDVVFRKARMCKKNQDRQRPIAEKLRRKFRQWHEKWEHENISRETTKQTNNWLMGKVSGLVSHTTTMSVLKDKVLSRNFYKVKLDAGTTSSNTKSK